MDKNCQQRDYMYTWNALTHARQSENVHPPLYNRIRKSSPSQKTRSEKRPPPSLGKHTGYQCTLPYVLNTMGGRVYFLTMSTRIKGALIGNR